MPLKKINNIHNVFYRYENRSNEEKVDSLRTNFNDYKRVEIARLFREDNNITIEYMIDIQ